VSVCVRVLVTRANRAKTAEPNEMPYEMVSKGCPTEMVYFDWRVGLHWRNLANAVDRLCLIVGLPPEDGLAI